MYVIFSHGRLIKYDSYEILQTLCYIFSHGRLIKMQFYINLIQSHEELYNLSFPAIFHIYLPQLRGKGIQAGVLVNFPFQLKTHIC